MENLYRQDKIGCQSKVFVDDDHSSPVCTLIKQNCSKGSIYLWITALDYKLHGCSATETRFALQQFVWYPFQ